MPIIFVPAAAASLVLIRCLKCGEEQARARAKDGALYACRRCGAEIVLGPETRVNRAPG